MLAVKSSLIWRSGGKSLAEYVQRCHAERSEASQRCR